MSSNQQAKDTMKKINSGLLAVTLGAVLFAGLVQPVSARSSAISNLEREQELRERARKLLDEKREETKTQLEQKASEFREQRQENLEQRRDRIAENAANRFENHVSQLSEKINRIESRISKMKAAGKDVAEAEAKLSAAKASLETAKTLSAEAVTKIKAVQGVDWDQNRSEIKAAREAVNAAQKSFVQVLKQLKEAIVMLMKENK